MIAAVAFLRNLNQGQRGNPTTAQLVVAFGAAGASQVRPVRGNGTVVLSAADPQACTDAAVSALAASSPWHDVGFALDVEVLAGALVAVPEDDARWEFSALGAGPLPTPPLVGRRCEVVAAGPGWAVSRNERDRESFATPTLERALGRPVTSRGVATVRRALAAPA